MVTVLALPRIVNAYLAAGSDESDAEQRLIAAEKIESAAEAAEDAAEAINNAAEVIGTASETIGSNADKVNSAAGMIGKAAGTINNAAGEMNNAAEIIRNTVAAVGADESTVIPDGLAKIAGNAAGTIEEAAQTAESVASEIGGAAKEIGDAAGEVDGFVGKIEAATETIGEANKTIGSTVETIHSAAGNTPRKIREYLSLSEFVDKALNLNDILAVVDNVLNKSDATELESNETESESGENSSYTIRRHRSYAQGLAYSNFLISYDTLLKGGAGLNSSPEIDALYHSQGTAGFMLLICVLIDMMAFFGGLLLFKDIYLIESNRKLDELGYTNYEAALTNLFTPPDGRKYRLLHLAVVYCLLRGNPYESASVVASISMAPQDDTVAPGGGNALDSKAILDDGTTPSDGTAPDAAEVPDTGDSPESNAQGEATAPFSPDSPETKSYLYNLFTSSEFRTMYQKMLDMLDNLGIREGAAMAGLRIWLDAFVKEKGVNFEDLFDEKQEE